MRTMVIVTIMPIMRAIFSKMLQLWNKLDKDHCNYEPELKLIEGVFVDVFQLEVHLCSEVDQIAQVGELVVSISSNQEVWKSCDDFEELNKYDPDVNLPTIFTGAPSGLKILCIFRLQKQRETMKNERNGKRRKRRWIFGIFATLYKSSRRRAVHLMRCSFFLRSFANPQNPASSFQSIKCRGKRSDGKLQW